MYEPKTWAEETHEDDDSADWASLLWPEEFTA
jgi:hypothetical protein